MRDEVLTKAWKPGERPEAAALLEREWLVSNGLGGYASGTICGAATRRYHGILVAALPAPLGRVMMRTLDARGTGTATWRALGTYVHLSTARDAVLGQRLALQRPAAGLGPCPSAGCGAPGGRWQRPRARARSSGRACRPAQNACRARPARPGAGSSPKGCPSSPCGAGRARRTSGSGHGGVAWQPAFTEQHKG